MPIGDAISLSLNKEMAKENRFRQAEIASLLVSCREQANIAAPKAAAFGNCFFPPFAGVPLEQHTPFPIQG
jgi:hypothetical protein